MVRNRSTLEGKPSNFTLQQARESLKRLDDLMRKLEMQAGMLQKYDDIIQD